MYVDEKLFGVEYTPVGLADFLVSELFADVDAGVVRVLDPACGDGALLSAVQRYADGVGFVVELFGCDVDLAAVTVAAGRVVGCFWVADFLGERSVAVFDVVVMNPPYVQSSHLASETKNGLRERFGLTGRVDLYQGFVAAGLDVLKPGGVLGLVCSNKFMFNKSGSGLRKTLAGNEVVRVFDLGDTRVFGKAVLPVVVVVKAADSDGTQTVPAVSVYRSDSDVGAGFDFGCLNGGSQDGFDVKVGDVEVSADGRVWVNVSERERDVLAVAVKAGNRLSELTKVRVGIKTCADSVFVNDWETVENKPEDDLLHDLLTPKSLRGEVTQRVLYPHVSVNNRTVPVELDDYPSAEKYLVSHADVLKKRSYVTAAGRNWWEIWVTQDASDWAKPKVVFPDISVGEEFSVDMSGAVVQGSCYYMCFDNEKEAQIVATWCNSRFAGWFYDVACGNRLYAGRRRWVTQYVKQIPVIMNPAILGVPSKEVDSFVENSLGIDLDEWF